MDSVTTTQQSREDNTALQTNAITQICTFRAVKNLERY